MVKVIKATIADVNTVAAMVTTLRHYFDNQVPSVNQLEILLADERSYLFVAVVADTPIGFALAYKFPSLYSSDYMAYLYDIEVLQNHRRKGVGRLLMGRLLKYLKDDKVTTLWLGTATDNVEAQALFHTTGGVKSGETFYDYVFKL